MKTCLAASLAIGLGVSAASAQTIDPFFTGTYTFADLGGAPNVPPNLGGLTMLAGTLDVLLLGGTANQPGGALYAVGVTRDGLGHINGFTGASSVYAPAPYNDGGVVYGPGGVLFASRWPANQLAQYLPGSTNPDKVIDLAPLGVAQSHAAINFVPAAYPGAGRMKLSSWSGGEFYDATFAPDGLGTFDITGVTQTATLPGGPEGFAYIPLGSPLFSQPTMIVSEYSTGTVGVYDLDANGDPIVASRRSFITGLTGAEGAFIDPYTGDFLFSTFGGGNHLIVVQGFVPAPGAAGLGAAMLILATRRRR